MSVARIRGLDAKVTSCVFIISLATSGDETTMVGTCPSRRCINGPWILAKSLSARCGRELASWCRFPIMGSFQGPGGSFEVWFMVLSLLNILSNINIKMKKPKRKGNKEGIWSSIEKVQRRDGLIFLLANFSLNRYSYYIYIYLYIYFCMCSV